MYDQIEELFSNLKLTIETKIRIILNYQNVAPDDLELVDFCTIKVLNDLIKSEDKTIHLKILNDDEKMMYRHIVKRSTIKMLVYNQEDQ